MSVNEKVVPFSTLSQALCLGVELALPVSLVEQDILAVSLAFLFNYESQPLRYKVAFKIVLMCHCFKN